MFLSVLEIYEPVRLLMAALRASPVIGQLHTCHDPEDE
jgi:hypothetical protein